MNYKFQLFRASLLMISLFPAAGPGMAAPANPPGRILTAPGNNNIIECTPDASNCIAVVANGNGAGAVVFTQANSPSVAANGAMALTSLIDVNGNCDDAGPCNPHVFIMNPDGTGLRQLTFKSNSAGYHGELSPAISPDGTMVAFLTNINTAPDTTHPNEIYLVNADGTNMRQLTPFQTDPNGNSQGYVSGFAWSPNSKALAYRGVVYTSACGTHLNQPIFVAVIGLIGADGNSHQVLACDNNDGYVSAIDWSPDGTLLAWARNVQHGGEGNSAAVGEPAIAFYDFSGQNRYSSGITSTQLAGSGADSCQNIGCIHFSPDGTRLAYQNEYPNGVACSSCTISIISLDGTTRTDTTIPVKGQFSWSGPTLQSIGVAPPNASVATGLRQQFTATGQYSDSSTQDLTTSVRWSSSDPSVAVISNVPGSQGLATGLATGVATIMAALNGVSGATQLTVTPSTASQQVSNLIALLNSFNLGPPAQSLLNKLLGIQNKIANAQLNSVCNDLSAFIAEVTAQSGKSLTINQANQLISGANQLRMSLGC